MVAEGDGGRDQRTAANVERFELERFGWGAPDRLELSGIFVGLRETDPGPPVLVVWGAGAAHRLTAVPESLDGPPEDGRRWRAEFLWEQPPVPFDAAQLE